MPTKLQFARIIRKQKNAADREMAITLNDTANELLAEHEKVVRQWTHKPRFKAVKIRQRTLQTIRIEPTGIHKKIWTYVDQGTRPHIIAAKNVPLLKFQTGYSARTAPVARANVGTGTASGAWVQKTVVKHPGTEARKFSETLLDELDPPLDERMQAAIERGYTKANR
jgi:hypothetical protein